MLALTSQEEIAKSQAVADYIEKLVTKSEFDKAFSKHEFKHAYNQRWLEGVKTKQGKETVTVKYNINDGINISKTRNNCLFVDKNGRKPKDKVTKDDAKNQIDICMAMLDDILVDTKVYERIGSKRFLK